MSDEQRPKAFISYSWTPKDNEEKVIAFAERLVGDGVDVILDKWNLKPGQNKYEFMLKMVKDPDIKNVLMMCNKDYMDKANEIKGGAGTESLIISNEVFRQVDQKKFVSVVLEKDNEDNPCIPKFMEPNIYIDLSKLQNYSREYEKLIRHIYDKPEYIKPDFGPKPAYLDKPEKKRLSSLHKLNDLEKALNDEKHIYVKLLRDFEDAYIKDMLSFEISKTDLSGKQENEAIEVVISIIKDMKELSCVSIKYADLISVYNNKISSDDVKRFLSKVLRFTIEREYQYNTDGLYREYRYDIYCISLYELFLLLINSLLKYELYEYASKLIYGTYMIPEFSKPPVYERIKHDYKINIFNQGTDVIQDCSKKVGEMYLKTFYDIMSIRLGDSIDMIAETDMLLTYVSLLNINNPPFEYKWISFLSWKVEQIPLLKLLISKDEFEKIKPIFNVNNVDDFKQIYEKSKVNIGQYFSGREMYGLSYIRMLNIKDIGSK